MGFDRVAWDGLITRVDTTAAYPLNSLRWVEHPTYGMTMWRYVQNGEGATAFAQGDVVQVKASTLAWGTGILAATAKLPRNKVLGVADHAIAAASYGWIICQGRCQVECDGSVAANDTIMCDGTASRRSRQRRSASRWKRTVRRDLWRIVAFPAFDSNLSHAGDA